MNRYRELTGDLVLAARRRDAALAAAHESYMDTYTAVDHDVTAARDALSSANTAAGAAQRLVAQTDLTAAALWDDLRKQRGRRIGAVPQPSGTAVDGEPASFLESAADRIERARRGGEPLPHRVLPALFVLGFVAGAVVAAFASMVLDSWLFLLPAPFAGLPLGRMVADQRYTARLDPGAIAVTVLGGVIATALIISR